jgi:hypothetical protein
VIFVTCFLLGFVLFFLTPQQPLRRRSIQDFLVSPDFFTANPSEPISAHVVRLASLPDLNNDIENQARDSLGLGPGKVVTHA